MEPNVARKVAFVLASTRHGPMIVDRFDQRLLADGHGYGVGLQLLETGSYDLDELTMTLEILRTRHAAHGHGVVAVDVGANIGAFALPWAHMLTSWGSVLAIEPQERLFYALAGNLALNNLGNARALWAALGGANGTIGVPVLDYARPASYGSLELRQGPVVEDIGQPIDHSHTYEVVMRTLDSFALLRLDLLKIDVERMELEVLEGARETLLRCRPVVLVEHLKTPKGRLISELSALGYVVSDTGLNLLAIHYEDPIRKLLT